ncbi:MAG: hypothetical protein K0Q73_801 [Paenibacillus sp.]|nr:hypothetical protein [Paenibacillus sp.]
MRKPLSRLFKDERPQRPRLTRRDFGLRPKIPILGFIANKKAVFGNRKLILSYVVKKEKTEEITPRFSPANLS